MMFPDRQRAVLKHWAEVLKQFSLQCSECRGVAARIFQGKRLLYSETFHIEQHVTAIRDIRREQRTPHGRVVWEQKDAVEL